MVQKRGKGKIGVAVIGLGMGQGHVAGYQQTDRAEVLAVCDINQSLAREVAARYQVPLVFTDYREMLQLDGLEVVSVCTPNYLHAPMSIDSLLAGKHVLVEKPLALNARQGAKMVEAAERSGKKLTMAVQRRFAPDSQSLKKLIEAGELGEIYHARAGYVRRMGVPGKESFWVKKKSGGGPLIDLGVHILDLTWWLMGCPQPVSASGATYDQVHRNRLAAEKRRGLLSRFDVEDLACALIRFEGGATIALEVSWASHIAKPLSECSLLGTKGGADLYGPDGLIMFTDLDGSPTDIQVKPDSAKTGLNMHQHFIDCIANDTEPLVSKEQALLVTEMLDAVYRSAEAGREVYV